MGNETDAEGRKERSRRAVGLWGSDTADRPEDIFVGTYVNHQEPDVSGGATTRSLDGYRELLDGYRRGFSDSEVAILLQIAEDNLVATRWEFTATNTGEYLGHPPSGRRATWTGIQIDRHDGDRIAESWVDWDKFRFFVGIGRIDPI
ncbi:MAG: ester cyclase [Actinomycetota bacterium]